MVLSGYEVLAETREAEASAANGTTPMLFCHGTLDPLVAVARGRQACRAHASPERPTEWHEFPIGHEVSGEEVAVIRHWLKARFEAVQTTEVQP
jgi:phospholipase/carboxylesterase